MKNRMIWVGRHEGMLRDISRACAYGDGHALRQGALILSAFIPNGSVITPMPSHIGYATTMYELCAEIVKINPTVKIQNCLLCVPHESGHVQKARGDFPSPVYMYTCGVLTPNCIIIDNCIGTGTTAIAALNAMPDARILAITKS